MPVPFIKMHGLGNDFIIIDLRDGGNLPDKAEIAAMANRKTGIGCDQMVFLCAPRSTQASVFLDMYNADASPLEACGNATRCVAELMMRESGQAHVVMETVAGYLTATRAQNGMISVDMGEPRFGWEQIPLSSPIDTQNIVLAGFDLPAGSAVNVGNPHIVFFLEQDVEGFPVADVGARIESNALFPNRINAEFCNILDRKTIRMRVWERGAGETQACGTGACATVTAAVRRDLVDRNCKVILDGGTLYFDWDEKTGHIFMTGSASYAFRGEWPGVSASVS